MPILWCRESVKDRRYEVGAQSGGSASRSFLVRVDDPSEPLDGIRSEPGIQVGDPHPEDGALLCEKISVRPRDDVGMLYEVSFDYKAKESADENNENGDQPGSLPGLIPIWSASSSVGSQPIWLDRDSNIITNSAGDPLEGLEADTAQFHLTLTNYFSSHDAPGLNNNPPNSWQFIAREYTNAVNDALWNGGGPGMWKCQGCSAKLNIDRQGENGVARVYWEVTWEFAYRYPTWQLEVWDVGFNELVDGDGDPIEVEGISAGSDTYGSGGGGSGSGENDGPCEGGLSRRSILGQDGRPVRQPVALQNGKAKAPCLRPDRLTFNVYAEKDFNLMFGELTTPQV